MEPDQRAGGLPGIESLSKTVSWAFRSTEEALLFSLIEGLCDEYRGKLASNYEDWLFVAIQMQDHLMEEHENPGLIPLVKSVRSQTGMSRESLLKAMQTSGQIG